MNNKIRNKVLKVGILFLAITALVLGIALPAYAQPASASNTPGFHIVQGIVLSVQNTSTTGFVVQTGNKSQVNVSVSQATSYFVVNTGKAQNYVNNQVAKDNRLDKKGPGPQQRSRDLRQSHIPANWRSDLGWLATFDNQASFNDIAAGDRVIVRADSNNLARQVLIIKAPVNRTIKGTITLADSTHITITPSTGSPITLNVTGTTRITLKGQTGITGYAVALYNSSNNNALVVNVQATAPTP